MKRKTPPTSLQSNRNSRLKIEIMEDSNEDDTTSSHSRSNVSAVADSDTQATEYTDEEESDAESSDISTSSDESSSDSDSDSDQETENEQADEQMTPSSSKIGASVYTDAAGLTTLRLGQKPAIDHSIRLSRSSLLKRLKHFLPELEQANKALEGEAENGSLKRRIIDVYEEDEEQEEKDDGEDLGDERGPYIEMV